MWRFSAHQELSSPIADHCRDVLVSTRKYEGSLSLTRPDFPFACGSVMAHRALELDHLGSAPPRYRRRTRGWGPALGHSPEKLPPLITTSATQHQLHVATHVRA